jgi:hypothetical protein
MPRVASARYRIKKKDYVGKMPLSASEQWGELHNNSEAILGKTKREKFA